MWRFLRRHTHGLYRSQDFLAQISAYTVMRSHFCIVLAIVCAKTVGYLCLRDVSCKQEAPADLISENRDAPGAHTFPMR
jgi:hypothetical protein